MTRARGRCDRGERLRSKAPFGHGRPRRSSPDCARGALDRAVGRRRADGSPCLRDLSCAPNSPRPSKNATSSSWTTCPPTKCSQPPRNSHPRAKRRSCFCRPPAPTWQSRNIASMCLRSSSWRILRRHAPCAPSTNSSEGLSAKSTTLRPQLKNAQTSSSKPQGMDLHDRPMLLVRQLRWGHVRETTEIDEIVELALARGLCVIAAERHVECITFSRREWEGIHQGV